MELGALLDTAVTFARTYPIIVIPVVLVMIYFGVRQPKEMLKLGVCVCFFIVVIYLVGLFTDTVTIGTKQKDDMIHKTERAIGE